MISFEKPYMLFFILLLIPVISLFVIRTIKIKKYYFNSKNVKTILLKSRLSFFFFSISWIFLIFALACPLWGAKPISVRRRGVSVIFVTDVSNSMKAADIKPSRLIVQKQFLKMLVEQLKEAAFGLVVTKGEGILSIPLSFEKNAIINAIDSLSPSFYSSSGTNLESGVMCALNSFGENRGNSKIIILCTDGGQTVGDLLQASEFIKKTDCILIIVGFGTESGEKISVLNHDGQTTFKHSRLEENFLTLAAKKAGEQAMYIQAISSGAVFKVIEKINGGVEGVEKMVYIQEPVKRNFEMTLFSLIFLCLGVLSFYEKN